MAMESPVQLFGVDRVGNSWSGPLPYRSGSAPPSVGSNLVDSSELMGSAGSAANEQIYYSKDYLEQYSSRSKLNPRLPPLRISKDQALRMINRVGRVGDQRQASTNESRTGFVYLTPLSTLSTHMEEPEDDKSSKPGSGSCPSDDVHHASSSENPSHNPVSYMEENLPPNSSLRDNPSQPSVYKSEKDVSFTHGNQSHGTLQEVSQSSVAGAVSPESGNQTTQPSVMPSDKNVLMFFQAVDTSSTSVKPTPEGTDSVQAGVEAEIESGMKALKVNVSPRNQQKKQDALQSSTGPVTIQGNYVPSITQGAHLPNFSESQLQSPAVEAQVAHFSGILPPFYTSNPFGNQNLQQSNLYAAQQGINRYSYNSAVYVPPISTPTDSFNNQSFTVRQAAFPSGSNYTVGTELSQQPYNYYGQVGLSIQSPIPDSTYIQFVQHPSLVPVVSSSQYNVMHPRMNFVGNITDWYNMPKVLPSPYQSANQRAQIPRSRHGNAAQSFEQGGTGVVNYQVVPSMVVESRGPSPSEMYSPGRRSDASRFQPAPRFAAANSGTQSQRGRERIGDARGACSFLEELKSNRNHKLELSDIAGRIVEYSADQHGSRFIQQKLENCSAEEKATVFEEVLPRASSLMTDVFGNYVIQKFFEHGSPEQRRELATKLVSQVLPLCLQMYGCRVIQKALEVIELDQKIQLVHELDGNVMRCVCDQNGNHVIQKCIECVPPEHIGFITAAFRGQVAQLSKHPYGCRVIQRVLEYCGCGSEDQCIIDEILQSSCDLAQDQYGNYVIQHVLEKGKPAQRSRIISQLAGQAVAMSQNKFASNVIEKCFEYGSAAERELLIADILSQTEGNDNLLVMMKDQFANYVVQRILETCDGKQREDVLRRIKGHMQALRKYTYGKHIANRVEQMIADGDNLGSGS